MDMEVTPQNAWTLNTLFLHITALIDAQEERNNQRFAAQKETTALALTAADRAVLKAETAAEKRFESVNEFRSTLSDQQRTLMPRIESEMQINNLLERLKILESKEFLSQGKAEGMDISWKVIIGLSGLGTTVLALIQFLGQ